MGRDRGGCSVTKPSGRTALYRVWGGEGVLLYIGVSNNLPHRWNNHMRVQPWWGELRSLTVEWYETRDEAEAAEETAIKAEQPKYNVTHLAGPTRRRLEAARTPRPVQVKLKPRDDDENLLTNHEAAAMARLEPGEFVDLVREGNGPAGFRIGKQQVFRKGEIRYWIAALEASQREASTPAAGAA